MRALFPRGTELWLPVLVASAVALLVFPIPTLLLDGLLAAQLGVAVMVLLAALGARQPLAMSQFPAILLLTTLMRLALNVSTTRRILADADAGQVVAAFGEVVVRDNLVVGAVVFIVLTLAQYLVIARGAERVAQVGARFALDGLPGRQLAIDADVRAGLLDPETARARRAALARESSLFGSMDGAMKFVRGDAIAGLCIVGINVVGGLAIGIGQMDLSPAEALAVYTRLTVGDGLVTQIPAVLTATAAAWMVTRVATPQGDAPGRTLLREVLADGVAPLVAGGLLLLLALLPGLPTVPLAAVAVVLGAAGWVIRRGARAATGPRASTVSAAPVAAFGLRLHPDALRGLPTGPGAAVEAARAILSQQYGVRVGAVAIDPDATDLPAASYRIEVREHRAASGVLPTDGTFAAPRPADATGAEVPHPITGAPGGWGLAGEGLNPTEYLAAHCAATWRRSGPAILGVQDVADAIAAAEARQPALVRAVVPRVATLPRLAELLQRLLAEDIPVRDLGAILEALAQRPPGEALEVQLSALRRRLAGLISQRAAPDGQLAAIYPDPSIEARLRADQPLGPSDVEALVDDLTDVLGAHPSAALVTGADVRAALRRVVAPRFPGLPVLAVEELEPGLETISVGLAG